MFPVRSLCTTEKAGLPNRAGVSCMHMYVLKILTSPSAASRKAAVSTPSSVMGTSANDCGQLVYRGETHLDGLEELGLRHGGDGAAMEQ